MHPSISRELMMARQQDELRAAVSRRLAAEIKQNLEAAHPADGTGPVAPVTRPDRVPQLIRLLARLRPA